MYKRSGEKETHDLVKLRTKGLMCFEWLCYSSAGSNHTSVRERCRCRIWNAGEQVELTEDVEGKEDQAIPVVIPYLCIY